MFFKDICYLGDIKDKTNSLGDAGEEVVYSEKHVFCNQKSIGYREFYEAQATGFKPEIMLEMSSFSYAMQKYVKYNNVEYKVVRTYTKGLDKIELTLERGINGST